MFYKNPYNVACYRAEKEISYSAKRASEWYFFVHEKCNMTDAKQFEILNEAFDNGCDRHLINGDQKEKLKNLLTELGLFGICMEDKFKIVENVIIKDMNTTT